MQRSRQSQSKPDRSAPREAEVKAGLHPKNRFRNGYDFDALLKRCPSLAGHLVTAPHGGLSIDFADPESVRLLNRALLGSAYGVEHWDAPEGSLCPPIPGRADYLHHLADLLAEDGVPPRGASVRLLDIGTGASCVYPIIGHLEYGWSFVGTDIDPQSLDWAGGLVGRIAALAGSIELRLQRDKSKVFEGILRTGETFAASLCNPPFHASAVEAAEGSRRKLRNLNKGAKTPLRLNFGGQGNELWCPGGELGFLRRMIAESLGCADSVRWFSSLVAKSEHLPPLLDLLKRRRAVRVRVIPMAQGQKKSRILAWSFQEERKRGVR